MELSHRYNLPPNDERLLALTEHEAAETLLAMLVLDERAIDPKKFQQAPVDGLHLTDDPEWNAMEYAAADPANSANEAG